jgi:hypothetical protein
VAVVHDLRCRTCNRVTENVTVDPNDFPRCTCGGEQTWIPSKAPRTDVYGRDIWSWALGDTVRSGRERDARMRAKGFEPSGDKVNGARDEGHLNLGKTTSFAGQSVRRTLTRER